MGYWGKLADCFFSFFIKGLIKSRREEWFLKHMVRAYDNHSHKFFRYKFYPKNTGEYHSLTFPSKTNKGDFAIVIQGLVELKDDFTLNTVLLYKKMFPFATIIISTWESTPENVVSAFKKLGCEVILNKTFEPSGFCNVNYQLFTTLNGIRRAKEIGAKYVLKNRSDLRINRDYSLEYLEALLMDNPVKADYPIPLHCRIVTVEGVKGSRFFPYWLQDFIYFGETEDLEIFFDVPQDTRDQSDNIRLKNINGRRNYRNGKEYCATLPPETFITRSFLSKYIELSDSIAEWWHLMQCYFLVLGFDDLDMLWPKYESTADMSNFSGYYEKNAFVPEQERTMSPQFLSALTHERIKYSTDAEYMSERYEMGRLCKKPKYGS